MGQICHFFIKSNKYINPYYESLFDLIDFINPKGKFTCHIILILIQVDAAHWWWLSRDPPT